MDECIGYEVLISELQGIIKAYCDLYGNNVVKKAMKQVYAEVLRK